MAHLVGDGFESWPAKLRVIIKDMSVVCDKIVRVGGMAWPKTGAASHYHAKLGFKDKGHAI